jgi:hypothetical protein
MGDMKHIDPVEVKKGKFYAMFNRAFFLQWFVVFHANTDITGSGACNARLILDVQFEADDVNDVSEHMPVPYNLNLQLTDIKRQLSSDVFEVTEEEVRNIFMQSI